MDDSTFDNLTRSFAIPSRRGLLSMVLGGVLATVGLEAADAKKRKGKGKGKKNKKEPEPQPCTRNCAGKQCGPDSCGGSCGSCGARSCLNGRCCVSAFGMCTQNDDCCTSACTDGHCCTLPDDWECEDDEECCSRQCIDGYCCGKGEDICDDGEGECCVGWQCVGHRCCGTKGVECQRGAECCDGLECNRGKCCIPHGKQGCSLDSDCCHGNRCTADGWCRDDCNVQGCPQNGPGFEQVCCQSSGECHGIGVNNSVNCRRTCCGPDGNATFPHIQMCQTGSTCCTNDEGSVTCHGPGTTCAGDSENKQPVICQN